MNGKLELQVSVLTVFLLVLLVLGDTYIQYLLFGAWGVFALGATLRLFRSKAAIPLPLLVTSGGLFIGVLISGLTTVNIPLTIQTVTYYFLGLSMFWYVYVLPAKVHAENILQKIVLLGVAISLMSGLFTVWQNMAKLLPGMNLLYATFGHNHVAAVLLIVLPLSWWWASQPKASSWRVMVPLLQTLQLIMSFGRVAIVVGCLQLLLMIWFAENSTGKSEIIIKRAQQLCAILLGIGFAFSLYVSVSGTWKTDFTCPLEQWETQLCKSLTTEARPAYWQQALKIWRDNFWLGSGPGTYGVSAIQHQQGQQPQSGYAHNAYLQALSEMGVVGGGLYMLFVGYLLIKAIKIAFNRPGQQWLRWVMISIVSIYTNVFFDFDWQFVGIWSLTLVLLAIMMRATQWQSLSKQKLLRVFLVMINTALVVLGGMYLWADVQLNHHQSSPVMRVFPYFHWHRMVLANQKLAPTEQSKLDTIYWSHPDYLYFELSQKPSADREYQLLLRLFEVDSRAYLYHDTLSYLLARKRFEQVITEVRAIQQTYAYHHMELPGGRARELAKAVVESADELYRQGEYRQAGEWYQYAQTVDPWILSLHPPIFMQTKDLGMVPGQSVFFEQLDLVRGEELGEYADDYALGYLGTVKKDIATLQPTDVKEYVQRTIRFNGWKSWEIWPILAPAYQHDIAAAVEMRQFESAFNLSLQLTELQKIVFQREEFTELGIEKKLATSLVEVGNIAAEQDVFITGQLYETAYQLNHSVFMSQQLWMEDVELSTVSTEEILTYLNTIYFYDEERLGGKVYEHQQLIEELIRRYESTNNQEAMTTEKQRLEKLPYRMMAF